VSMLTRSALRDLRIRLAQFVAVWLTIVLGVALFGASYDAFQNLTASYQRMYDNLAFADLTVTGGPVDQIVADGAGVEGVTASATRSVGDGLLRIDGRTQLGRVVGMPSSGEPAVDRVMILRGHDLTPGASDEVLVEHHVADARGVAPGSSIDVLTATGWRTLKVAGIVASPEYLWPARSRQEVMIPFDEWGVVFGPESLVGAMPADEVHQEALFTLAQNAPASALDDLVAIATADGASSTQARAEQPSVATLQEDVSGFGEMSIMFPVMFLLAAALATSVLLGRMVASQRPQIGVLRANGFSRATILRHYLAFGLILGVAGSIPGALLGALFADAISRLYTSVIGVPITDVQIRPLTIFIGFLMGPLTGAVAAYLPARRASRIAPAEAMRGSVAVGGIGDGSLLEKLVPPLRRLPTRWLVSLRGLGRSRRRSIATIVGVAIATTLVLVSWGMLDTTQILLDRQFLQVQQQDATVYFAQPVPATSVSSMLRTPGVAAVEPQLQMSATIVHGDRRYATTLVGLETSTTMHGFIAPDGSSLQLPEHGLVVGAALRDRLGISAGDQVEVDPVSGGSAATVPIAGFVDEPLGTFAYASLDTVASLASPGSDPPAVDSALVKYEPGADRTATADQIRAIANVAGVLDSRGLYDLAQQLMGLFYAFVGVMLVLGAVMAFALIFNTLTANITERATELAVLRTLGMSRGSISRLVTGENLVLTFAGVVVGLVVGYAVAVEFMASFSSDLFSFDLKVRPTTFLFTAIAVVLVGFVSQWPALRAVGRIDLGRIVRERSL
jgi:putative ABC transport system permease protein